MSETKINQNQVNLPAILVSVTYNNGTFIKEYSNKYVEIFGFVSRNTSSTTVNLPVTMANSDYYCSVSYGGTSIDSGDTDSNLHISPANNGTSTTQIVIYNPRSVHNPDRLYWEVKGFKA